MDDKGLREALEIFGQSYIAELSNQLRKLDKKASGDLLRSLDSRVIQTAFGTKYTIVLKAEDYLQYVDRGRRPGKFPPVDAIAKWVRLKGISPKAIYPIGKKIKEKGIKPTNVIQKSLDKTLQGIQFRKLEDGMSDWVDDMVEQMALDISKNNNITVR
jgi:hypothetical protein